MAANSGVVPKPSLGQYVFSEKLGSGTYATVYKAYRKTGIREVVAIKCVLKSSLNKASTDNLLTEIEILKNLKHEYIVTLKDFQWDANYIYLVMEFCSGGDLSRFIRSKRALPEHVVKRFLQQIASAMKFLWDNNIAHMDLKPQNILLSSTSSPQIKLADFGFAKPLYEGDSLHVMRGSPLYMAPEIICKKQYDNRVDLWSIGVILFECLFGKAPFASKSYRELGEKIWDDKPIEIPHGFNISDNARDLLLRLLKRDPSERIRFEDFFSHPFVDMEHLPSKDSLPNAKAIVSKAVDEDKKGNLKSAVKLYCEALSFFMPAIHYESNSRNKDAIRKKVKEYMARAEVLKQMMKPQSTKKSSSNNHHHHPQHNTTPENSLAEMSIHDHPCHDKSPSSQSYKTSKPASASPLATTSPSHNLGHDESSSGSTPEISGRAPATPPSRTTPSPFDRQFHDKSYTSPSRTVSASSSPSTASPSSPKATGSASPSCSPSSTINSRTQTNEDSTETDYFSELFTLCADSPTLKAALEFIKCALIEEQVEEYKQCLHHFEVGLGALLKILPDEPKGRRKNLINSQMTKWMDKAEAIKAYLEVQHLDTAKGSPMLDEDAEMSKKSPWPLVHHTSRVIHFIHFVVYSIIIKIYAFLYRTMFGQMSS